MDDVRAWAAIGALMMCSDNHPSRRKRVVEYVPPERQPSNRKAALLEKSMRRAAQPQSNGE